MAKIANVTQLISRGTIIGRRVGVQPTDEAQHFFRCELCGGFFDKRVLGAVLDHEARCRIRLAIRRSTA